MEPILEHYQNLCDRSNCPSYDLVLACFGICVNVAEDWKTGVDDDEDAELISLEMVWLG